MSVRRREWSTRKGVSKKAWIVDYMDGQGARCIQTFERKKDADAYHATVKVDVRKGLHVAQSKSVTVAEAGRRWIEACEANGLERTTLDSYRQHTDLHITPYLGNTRLSQITVATVRDFQDRLRRGQAAPGETEAAPRSMDMVKRVTGSLGALLADAQERGLVAQNVVRSLRANRRRGKERQAERRQKGKLKVGFDIPTPDEIRAIVEAAKGRWRPLLLVAIFCGLRASELRGLRWEDVDFKKGELHVRQRADRYKVIGKPKSDAGERTVPIPPKALSVLREWKLSCPKGELGLVFPSGAGHVELHSNIAQRGLIPTMIEAGVTVPVKDARGKPKRDGEGKPVVTAKYTGLHSLRHFFASWCINREADGGLELPLKVVQERLGHSSIAMTADRYGHLFARGDDSAELAAAEGALFG
jgi:integrase